MEFKSVDSFLNYLKVIKDYSSDTIQSYESDLKLFFNYLNENKTNIKCEQDITLQDMYDFLGYCINERGNSARTNNRRVACLKSYWKYLFKKVRLVEENIAEELETSKIHFRNQNFLTIEQSAQLLKSLDDWNCNYERDYCILTLFLNLGLRLSELTNIKLSDIEGNKITIIGKGNKQRVLFFNNDCLNAIDKYLNARKFDCEYLFVSTRGKQISKITVETLVKKHLKEAGLSEIIWKTHSLRRTAGTLMYQATNDIRFIQSVLGHSNVNTTQLYVTTNEEMVRDKMSSLSLVSI